MINSSEQNKSFRNIHNTTKTKTHIILILAMNNTICLVQRFFFVSVVYKGYCLLTAKLCMYIRIAANCLFMYSTSQLAGPSMSHWSYIREQEVKSRIDSVHVFCPCLAACGRLSLIGSVYLVWETQVLKAIWHRRRHGLRNRTSFI